jgi:glutaredoxin
MVELVVFSMPTCPHCVELKKHLRENDINFRLLSIDNPYGKEKAEEYGVTNYPTLFFVQNGKIIDAQVGFNPETNIKEVLENYETTNR